MPHPTQFRSTAYRALVKTLGESDAVVEWIEDGVRELQRINTNNGISAVKDLANRHDVCVHPIDFIDLRSRCARLQILAVYQQIEYFLESFRKTHPKQVDYSSKTDGDRLSRTLSAFNITSRRVGQLEVDLFQYYRLTRNLIMHDPEGDQRKTHKGKCKELRAQVMKSSYNTLFAPNIIEELCFDDFVLFTRAGKQLAGNLCEATSPTNDELVTYAQKDVSLMKKIRSLSKNRKRCINLVACFFRERFSISEERSIKLGELVLTERDPLA